MIDIHPNDREVKIPPQAARPFQIPLGALLPLRPTNLIAAAKNIGTTHITNGSYRLHPVEWNIGESAGLLAAFCLERGILPGAVAGESLRHLQQQLVGLGVPLYWFPDVAFGHPAWAAVQLLGAWGIWPGEPERLEFGPEEPLALEAAQALLMRAGALSGGSVPPPGARLMPRAEWARLILRSVSP
jgi:hypothetical protein